MNPLYRVCPWSHAVEEDSFYYLEKSSSTFRLSDFTILQVQSLEDIGFEFQFAPRISACLKNNIAQFLIGVFKSSDTCVGVRRCPHLRKKGASLSASNQNQMLPSVILSTAHVTADTIYVYVNVAS